MSKPRHLTRAPLREALIDIQFDPPTPLEKVREFRPSNAERFGTSRDIWQASIGMQFAEDGASRTSADSVLVGKRLDATNAPHVVQFRKDGFTFSRLYPYDSWPALREPAIALWREFAAAAGVLATTRIALRYINELKLPLPLRDFADYLTAPPQVPSSLPQGLAGFLQRTVIVNQASDNVAIVTQAMEETPASSSPSGITVVLDIDAFYQKRLSVSDERFARVLEDLHAFKNAIFFEYVTDRALELFE